MDIWRTIKLPVILICSASVVALILILILRKGNNSSATEIVSKTEIKQPIVEVKQPPANNQKENRLFPIISSLFFVTMLLATYFLPAIIAYSRKHINAGAILLLLLLPILPATLVMGLTSSIKSDLSIMTILGGSSGVAYICWNFGMIWAVMNQKGQSIRI